MHFLVAFGIPAVILAIIFVAKTKADKARAARR
jgi:hypothetical protein